MKTLMITTAALTLAAPVFAQTAGTTTENDPTILVVPGTDTQMEGATATGTTSTDGTLMDSTGTGATTAGTMPLSQDGVRARVALSEQSPGFTAGWIEDRAIYTTNQPSTTAWDRNANRGTTRPADWNQIGEVDDVVLSADGQVLGYIADIGGFLGLGQHTVMLSPDVLNLVDFDGASMWGSTQSLRRTTRKKSLRRCLRSITIISTETDHSLT